VREDEGQEGGETTIPDDYYYDRDDANSSVDTTCVNDRPRTSRAPDDQFDHVSSVDPRYHPSKETLSPDGDYGDDVPVPSSCSDVWIYLFASSLVSASSIARAHSWHSDEKMGARTAAIVALTSVTAAVSLTAVGAGETVFRTSPRGRGGEYILATFALLLWTACMILYNVAPTPGNNMEFPNLFYSLWISGISSMYLVAHCGTTTTARTASWNTMPHNHCSERETVARLWTLLFFSSVLLLSFSASARSGLVCEGPAMRGTSYCASTIVSLVASILSMIACFLYVGSRVASSGSSLSSSSSRYYTNNSNIVERSLALTVLIAYTCNAGIATGPGGFGAGVGNVYVSSWFALTLALVLNVKYFGFHFATIGVGECDDGYRRPDAASIAKSVGQEESDMMW